MAGAGQDDDDAHESLAHDDQPEELTNDSNKRKRDEANEAKIQAGTHERLPNGHVRKIVERKEKVVKEPRVKKEKVYKMVDFSIPFKTEILV